MKLLLTCFYEFLRERVPLEQYTFMIFLRLIVTNWKLGLM